MKDISIFLVMLATMVACDPGIAIRQRRAPSPNIAEDNLEVSIATSDLLIGETRYFPRIDVTNRSARPLRITAVDLVTTHETYANHPSQLNIYPFTLAEGTTKRLEVIFELAEPVNRAFQKPAELRVHYTIGGFDRMATVTLEGGHLR